MLRGNVGICVWVGRKLMIVRSTALRLSSKPDPHTWVPHTNASLYPDWLTGKHAQLSECGVSVCDPYLDGAIHWVQSLLRQLFQGT